LDVKKTGCQVREGGKGKTLKVSRGEENYIQMSWRKGKKKKKYENREIENIDVCLGKGRGSIGYGGGGGCKILWEQKNHTSSSA